MADDLQGGAPEDRGEPTPRPIEAMVNDVLDEVDRAEGPPPPRFITVRMAGEDVRALMMRLALFTGEDALANIRLTVCDGWVQGVAGDGYVLAIQKMRCEADTDGVPAVFHLTGYDAARIAGIVPKPRKDEILDDVALNVVVGGGEQQRHPVNAVYQEPGRVASYSCEAAKEGPPTPSGLLALLSRSTAKDARFNIQPAFLVSVAKASTVARDQQPYDGVRFYVTEERASMRVGGGMIPGPIVAQFSYVAKHDNFVAVLMPFAHEWSDEENVDRVVERIEDMVGAGDRLHPKPTWSDEAGA